MDEDEQIEAEEELPPFDWRGLLVKLLVAAAVLLGFDWLRTRTG